MLKSKGKDEYLRAHFQNKLMTVVNEVLTNFICQEILIFLQSFLKREDSHANKRYKSIKLRNGKHDCMRNLAQAYNTINLLTLLMAAKSKSLKSLYLKKIDFLSIIHLDYERCG